MFSKNIVKLSFVSLVLLSGVGFVTYNLFYTKNNISQNYGISKSTDPLTALLGKDLLNENKNLKSKLKADFLTPNISNYDGPIPKKLQECIDLPFNPKEKNIIAPYNPKFTASQTTSEILQDINPVLGYAVRHSQINWRWDAKSQKYTFWGSKKDAKLWWCYFREGTTFFQNFFKKDEISLPFEDVLSISFKSPTLLDYKYLHYRYTRHIKQTGENLNKENLIDLEKESKSLDEAINRELTDLKEEIKKTNHTIKISSQEVYKNLKNLKITKTNLVNPSFFKKLQSLTSQDQKIQKVFLEKNKINTIPMGFIQFDGTKDISLPYLSGNLLNYSQIDTKGNKQIITIFSHKGEKISKHPFLKSIRLQKITDNYDPLKEILIGNTDDKKLTNIKSPIEKFKIIAEIDGNAPIETQYQLKIDPNYIKNYSPIKNIQPSKPIYSTIIEISGVKDNKNISKFCPTYYNPVCGSIDTIKNKKDSKYQTFSNMCELKKQGYKFEYKGKCKREKVFLHEERIVFPILKNKTLKNHIDTSYICGKKDEKHKTFINEEELKRSEYKFEHKGKCKEENNK